MDMNEDEEEPVARDLRQLKSAVLTLQTQHGVLAGKVRALDADVAELRRQTPAPPVRR